MTEAQDVYILEIKGVTMDNAGKYGFELTNRAGDKNIKK